MRSIYRRTQDRSFPLSRISIIQAMMFVLPIVFMTNSVALAVVRFVDATRPDDSGDSLSWATAERTLQAALQSAGSGDEIWVAVGTYYPDEGPGITLGDRTATYQLINGVAIYGGFAGSETLLSERNFLANVTILSGDLSSNDGLGDFPSGPTYTDNSQHVVTGSGTIATAILDGFTVSDGNADAGQSGGGMLNNAGSPTVTDCIFSLNAGNTGGAMDNISGSNPTVTDCTFISNAAVNGGGAMHNSGSSPTVVGCEFRGNTVDPTGAGAVFNQGTGSPSFTNCTFVNNTAAAFGGVTDNFGGVTPTFANCVFNNNSAGANGGAIVLSSVGTTVTVINSTFSRNAAFGLGGGVRNAGATVIITNCVFWDNTDNNGVNTDESSQIDATGGTTTVNYTLVQGLTGGFGGTGNVSGDPIFVDVDGPDNVVGTQDDDLRIWIGSPAIDAGDNDALPADTTDLDDDMNTTEEIPFDLAGNDRRIDDPNVVDTGNAGVVGTPIVDMGASEFVPPIFNNCQASFNAISSSSDRNHEFRIADDFIPLVSDINRIDWTGVWGGQEGGVNCNDNPPDSTWYLTIYADDGNGLPDMNNIVTGPELPFTHDGRLIVDFQPDFKPTEYSAPVNVTGLIPGNCYWIEILGEGSGDLQGAEACQWNWMRTDTSSGAAGGQVPSQDGNGWSVRLAAGHPIAYTEANLINIDFAWCADSGIAKNTLGNEGIDGGCGDRTGTYACCYRDILDDLLCTSTVTLFECILSPADNGLDGTAFTGTVCPDGGGSFVCAPPVNDDCATAAIQIPQASCTAVTDIGNCSLNLSSWCSPIGSSCGADGTCIAILDADTNVLGVQFDCTIVPTDNRFATTDGPSTMNNASVIDDCSGSGANIFRADVWWKVIAPCSGVMNLTMCGGGVYDAMMATYTTCPDGNDNTAPDLIECNDDACGTFATVSQLPSFSVALDQEVTIRIGGWALSGTDGSAGQGQSQLHVRFACNVPDAQDFNWDNPAGGGFLDAGNWNQAGVPSFFDNVFFDLSTASYTVTFADNVTTAGLSVGNDVVTFDLGGNQYTITSFVDIFATNNSFTSQLSLSNGTIEVVSPARVVVSSGVVNSTANLILDGATTSLMANELHVGGFSEIFTTGTLSLLNGADATITGSEPIRIGRSFSQTGTVNVDGAGSILNCTASGMTVGWGGSGTLNVTNGGNVNCESINLAVNASAVGTVLVTGANSSISTTSRLNVGAGMGAASITISAGGSVNSIAGGVIGDTTMGDVTITGTNSSWTIGGGFDLGTTSTGQGILTIQSGGMFDQSHPGDGFRVGLVGQLQVLAGGTLRTGGSITPGGSTTIGTAAGSPAMLTIDGASALWETYGPTDIGVNGPAIVTISNGGVMTDVSGFGTTIGPDGQVFGGTLNGDYFNSGRVHPGTSPGVLTITGNYTQNSDGQLILEIDGSASSSFDQIDISGVATLDGKLVIERAFIFTPTLGETFTVMTYASRVGMFAQVDRSPIGNGLAFQLNYNATDLTLEVVTDCNFNGIPDSEDLANCAGDPDCSDCNGNGIPDACDIDQCDRAIDPTCDDCNSNDIPDLCDLTGVCNGGINNGLDCLNSTNCDGSPCVGAFSADTNSDGIPDECLVADGGGGSTNYTDGTNWVGGVAAINDAADSFSATLDGCSAQLILDADVSVDTMNILSCSSLDVSGGNLTVVTTDGVDVNGDTSGLRGVVAAELSILDTRVVTVVNMQVRKNGFVLMDGLGSLVVSDTLEIAAGGRVSKDPVAIAVAASIDAGTVVISGGSCASGLDGGELVLDDKMSLNITGDLIMNGSTETAEDCTPLRGGVTPPPKFDPNGCGGGRRTSTPTVTIGGSLRMQDNVVVSTSANCARRSSVVDAAQVLVKGNVINHSTAPLTFDWSTGGIELSASDVHIFEVASRDVGVLGTGFALQGCSKTLTPCGPGTPGCSNEVCTPYTNESMGLIDIGDNATVTFVDDFDNDPFIRGAPEALYVDTLTVGAGASVTIDNCSVYFRTLIPPNFVPTLVGTGRFETLLEPAVAAPAPHDVTKDRYLSFDPSANAGKLTALRVLRVGSFAPWYVSCTLQDTGADGMLGALVQTPEFCDWTDSIIHVRGCEIVPGNEYLVDATVNDVTFSTPLSMMTTTPQFSASRQFGDVVGSLVAGAWTAPDGLVTTNDIVAVVQKFQLNPTAPHLSRVDNDGKTPNGIVASNDILRAVVAFAGGEFGSGVMNCLTGTCVPSCP